MKFFKAEVSKFLTLMAHIKLKKRKKSKLIIATQVISSEPISFPSLKRKKAKVVSSNVAKSAK